MACAICNTRRPRRFCPGVNGEICALCCGTEREVTVACPFECEYLAEARRRERPASLEGVEIPNRDVEVTERFVATHEPLLNALASALAGAAIQTGAIDADAREALDALTRTYRTLAGGIYYETRPAGHFAGAIYGAMQEAAAQFRAAEQRELGLTRTRDADVLALAVFLQRIELDRNNGRARGRAFLDSLRRFYSPPAEGDGGASESSLLLP